jgi:hypothetical protein
VADLKRAGLGTPAVCDAHQREHALVVEFGQRVDLEVFFLPRAELQDGRVHEPVVPPPAAGFRAVDDHELDIATRRVDVCGELAKPHGDP